LLGPKATVDGAPDEAQIKAWKEQARKALENVMIQRDSEVEEKHEDEEERELSDLKSQAKEALVVALVAKPAALEEAKCLARDALAAALLRDRASEDDMFTGCSSEQMRAAKERRPEALIATLGAEELYHQEQLEDTMRSAGDALTCALGVDQDITLEDLENCKAKARDAMMIAFNITPKHRREKDLEEAKTLARSALVIALMDGEASPEELEFAKSACRDALALALLGDGSEEDPEDVQRLRSFAGPALETAFLGDGDDLGAETGEGNLASTNVDTRRSYESVEDIESFDEMRMKLAATKKDMTTFNASLKAEMKQLRCSLDGLMKKRDLLKSQLRSSGVLQ